MSLHCDMIMASLQCLKMVDYKIGYTNMVIQTTPTMKPRLWDVKKYSANAYASRIASVDKLLVHESPTCTVIVTASAWETYSQVVPDRHDSNNAPRPCLLRMRHQVHQDLWRLQREAGQRPPQRQGTCAERAGRQGEKKSRTHLKFLYILIVNERYR